MNTYSSRIGEPHTMTLLAYRPLDDVDAWVEVWVKEGDLDKEGHFVCFLEDGSQISINDKREVFKYVSQVYKWRSPAPKKVYNRMRVGKLRQKTIYVPEQIGVDARFRPVYRRRDANAQVLRTAEV